MTTNVLLNELGTEPLRFEEEYFILRRNNISYRISLEIGNQYDGEGDIILTSNRLVILIKKQNTNFRAIEIPLNQIFEEEFKQPLFGKNYLTGKYRPIFGGQFGSFAFTIWLKGNRMGTLVGAFFTLIDSFRNNQGRNHNYNIIKNLKDNNFNAIFAIDPDDESIIYENQPPAASIPVQNFQSVIINRRPDFNNFNYGVQNNNNNLNNNNRNINFSRLNEEEIRQNNDVYKSTFVYKNPNNNNKFVYKDPGFVYKQPVNNNFYNINNIDKNIENNNININNINNNIKNINNNINNNNININNNIIRNNININHRNNISLNQDDDDDDLISPYNIKKQPEQRNNNIINNNNYNYPRSMIIPNNNIFIQRQIPNGNIQGNLNNINKINDQMNLNNPYEVKNEKIVQYNSQIIYQNNPQINQGYPGPIIQNNLEQNIPNKRINNEKNIQMNQLSKNNNNYGHIGGPEINEIKTIEPGNKPIINNNNIKIKDKYKQLHEEIPDEYELNSKNKLNDNINESNISFNNNQDLSLLSRGEESLPDLSNIYPNI